MPVCSSLPIPTLSKDNTLFLGWQRKADPFPSLTHTEREALPVRCVVPRYWPSFLERQPMETSSQGRLLFGEGHLHGAEHAKKPQVAQPVSWAWQRSHFPYWRGLWKREMRTELCFSLGVCPPTWEEPAGGVMIAMEPQKQPNLKHWACWCQPWPVCQCCVWHPGLAAH